jgi:aspartyl-tRNA(Asn)/glutamyl-tRNA(Gln) amidotransferase subunit A
MATKSNTDVALLSIGEQSKLIASKKLSPVELTQAYLDRIEGDLGKKIDAYLLVTADRAMADAKRAEAEIAKGKIRGPLHGIPMAHKDNYDTKGITTTGNSAIYEHRVPDKDATTITKLARAGAGLLGKLKMHEFASAGPETSLGLMPHNPWNLEYSPGGSSSGSGAGVAAGLMAASLGSDTGGSVRGPASNNGIVGLKPTYGRVSRAGVLALSWSQDYPGPLTINVEDNALLLQAIAGYDPADQHSARVPVPDYSANLKKGVKGMKVGVLRESYLSQGTGNPEAIAAVEKALGVFKKLGAELVDITMPSIPYMSLAWLIITQSEMFGSHHDRLRTEPEKFGDLFRQRLYFASLLTAQDYIRAQQLRSRARREFQEAFSKVDIMVTPTGGPAQKEGLGERHGILLGGGSTNPFSLAGVPAISVPCGFSEAGLPLGLQIGGKAFDEATVFQAAYAYEDAAGFKNQRAPIALEA